MNGFGLMNGIGFGVFFKNMNPIQMPFMSFQKCIVDRNPLSTALCLSWRVYVRSMDPA